MYGIEKNICRHQAEHDAQSKMECELRKVYALLQVYVVNETRLIVGHRLATKVFIGKLPATRGVWVIIG